jgi:hypothetical protein
MLCHVVLLQHNVYECWLHPKRFRTQMCQQGAGCKRTLCFFAHNLQELRFAEGQLQRGAAPPAPQEASPGLASPAQQAAAMLPALTEMRQQQQQQAMAGAAAAAAAMGQGPPALVPYGMMAPGGVAGNLPPLQPGLMPSPVQQQWVPGYIMPQGYVMLGGGQHQAQMMPGMPLMPAGDFEAVGGQQQQYLPTTGQWWSPAGAAVSSAAMRAAAAAVCRPLGPEAAAQGRGFGALHLDPSLVSSRQYQVVPDEQVLLGQPGGMAGEGSAGYLAAQQQAQQEAVAAAVSGSQYSWSTMPAVGPSTTSASASMSGLSMPTAGLSSSASVPGSSNNSLTHIRHGQGGAVSLDVLQATMQQMSVRDCHVRDL